MMDSLPVELVFIVLMLLDLEDLCPCSLTNKRMYEIMNYHKKQLGFYLIQDLKYRASVDPSLYLAVKHKYWKWIYEITSSEGFCQWTMGLTYACEFGHLDVIKYLVKESKKLCQESGKQKISIDWKSNFEHACSKGQVECMIFFFELRKASSKFLKACLAKTCIREVSKSCSLEALQFIEKHVNTRIFLNCAPFQAASSGNDLFFFYLADKYQIEVNETLLYSSTNLAITKYLVDVLEKSEPEQIKYILREYMLEMVKKDILKIVQYLHEIKKVPLTRKHLILTIKKGYTALYKYIKSKI